MRTPAFFVLEFPLTINPNSPTIDRRSLPQYEHSIPNQAFGTQNPRNYRVDSAEPDSIDISGCMTTAWISRNVAD
jgi:hypothetical protein